MALAAGLPLGCQPGHRVSGQYVVNLAVSRQGSLSLPLFPLANLYSQSWLRAGSGFLEKDSSRQSHACLRYTANHNTYQKVSQPQLSHVTSSWCSVVTKYMSTEARGPGCISQLQASCLTSSNLSFFTGKRR